MHTKQVICLPHTNEAYPYMTLAELKRLVALGEGARLEFKRKVADPLKVLREMVAFANSQGGVLLIGVNDDGHITGLKHPEEEIFVMEKVLNTHAPDVVFHIELIPLNQQKQIVAFHIEESQQKPVYLLYNLKRKTGRAYIRVRDRSVQTSREVRRVLKGRSEETGGTIRYGNNEHLLMRYLDQHPFVDLATFASVANISLTDASDVLVSMTVANVLDVLAGEERDLFFLKDTPHAPVAAK